MRIECLKLKNFKVFRNIEMKDIPRFCVLVGANGTGKSTLFDVFGFLKDCLTFNITRAFQSRGGFKEVVSRGHDTESIVIELQFRMPNSNVERLVTYHLEIGTEGGRPVVDREILRYKRGAYGSPYHFRDEMGDVLPYFRCYGHGGHEDRLHHGPGHQLPDTTDFWNIRSTRLIPFLSYLRETTAYLPLWHEYQNHMSALQLGAEHWKG